VEEYVPEAEAEAKAGTEAAPTEDAQG
jgi:hypothetical protein